MTFLEKLKEDYPEKKIRKDYLGLGCPSQYGYEEVFELCGETPCDKCWDREMPNTAGIDANYKQGLNDAWELFRKVNEMSDEDYDRYFGLETWESLTDLTPQEALAKLKAYEEQSKIEVGDIIEGFDYKALVIDSLDDRLFILTEVGCVEQTKRDGFTKTGKHIDIQSILEQIKG